MERYGKRCRPSQFWVALFSCCFPDGIQYLQFCFVVRLLLLLLACAIALLPGILLYLCIYTCENLSGFWHFFHLIVSGSLCFREHVGCILNSACACSIFMCLWCIMMSLIKSRIFLLFLSSLLDKLFEIFLVKTYQE